MACFDKVRAGFDGRLIDSFSRLNNSIDSLIHWI